MKMDIYNGRYFKINKVLLASFGLWPSQLPIKKFCIRTVLITLMLITALPQLNGLYVHFGKNSEKVMEHIGVVLYIIGVELKFITTILAEKKLKVVYESIAENWVSLQQDDHERKILHEYSERGRTLSIGYITYMFSALLFYICLPNVGPKVLDILKPLNESRALLFILNGEFPMDPYPHYVKIYIFDCFFCILSVGLVCCIDCIYAACIEHCLGLFAIVKFRLETSTSKFVSEKHCGFEQKHTDVAYGLIIQTIKLHKGIIRFSDLLESSYSTSFLILIGINMIYCTVLSVLLIIKRDDLMERFRYSTILLGIMIHLFYVSWPGQKMIDYSGGLFEDTYMNEWYDSSIGSQNLLRFMTLRCLTPCQLTAGGLYTMNLYNFASIIKTSASYITVFASFT